jgi:SAM-dependent methyltransferase
VGDARDLKDVERSAFDAAICIMALSNIDPLLPVMQGVAAALKPGGCFVWVITHPAFRAAGQSDWGWDSKQARQYRRVDGYLSPGHKPIEMNPGKAARGEQTATTWTFHRPMQTYFEAMSEAGLLVQRLEEWPSLRASTSGPRAAEENRARREIPLFLGVRALKSSAAHP